MEKKGTNISDILTFNKIRAITQTAEDIMTALKESEIIETEQESQMMRRKQPFVRIDDDERTIYVKNFTLYPAPTVEELTTFFGQYGKVDGVTIRKYVGGRAFKVINAFTQFIEAGGNRRSSVARKG